MEKLPKIEILGSRAYPKEEGMKDRWSRTFEKAVQIIKTEEGNCYEKYKDLIDGLKNDNFLKETFEISSNLKALEESENDNEESDARKLVAKIKEEIARLNKMDKAA